MSLNSRILIDLLKIKKIRINKIIDNNELFQGKIYKDIRILNRFRKYEINNKLIFIPFEFNHFFKRQKIYKIKKEKLIFFKFNKFSDFLFK